MSLAGLKKTGLVMTVMLALMGTFAQVNADPPRPGYLIITTNAIYGACRASIDAFLLDKQTNHGFAASYITETQWGSAPGAGKAEKVRGWLQANHLRLRLQYALLIGDPDPDDPLDPADTVGDLPMMIAGTQPTDFYYAELGTDPGAALDPANRVEVMVGRIPFIVTDPPVPGVTPPVTWLDLILDKTRRYTNETPLQAIWRRNAILPIHPLVKHTDPSNPDKVREEHEADTTYLKGEALKDDVLVPNGVACHRIYECDIYPVTPPAQTTPCDWDVVNNVWRNGRFGLAYWNTHGWAKNADRVMLAEHIPGVTYDALDLNPDYPAFVYQDSCSNARPEVPDNLAYAMLKKGALTTVAATRDIGPAGTRPTNYFYRLVNGRRTAGEAFFAAQEGDKPDALLNLFGDPSARYWLPLPFSIDPRERIHSHAWETGTITVTADPGFYWEAATSDGWITVTSGSSGTGNGTVTYTVAPNPNGVIRTGSIIVGEYERFTVTQSEFVRTTELSTALNPADAVDFNNDGRMDIVFTRSSDEGAVLYRNDGPGGDGNVRFTPLAAVLSGLLDSGLEWGDFDNDGYADVVVTGGRKNEIGLLDPVTRLYRNAGRGTASTWEFIEITAPLTAMQHGWRSWGDYDNDGDLDLLLTGFDRYDMIRGTEYTKLFRNDGPAGGNNWAFTEVTTGMTPVHSGRTQWVDFDNDGRLDVVLTGTLNMDPAPNQGTFRLYRNAGPAGAGAWTFTQMAEATLTSCQFSCGDYDGDGDVDLFTSRALVGTVEQYVMRNDIIPPGTVWNFTRRDYGLSGDASNHTARWLDYNHDGALDFSIRVNALGKNWIKVYRNDLGGLTGGFIDSGYAACSAGALWADFDGDNDLDLFATGSLNAIPPTPHTLYRNITPRPNTVPSAPGSLSTSVTGRDATFSWIAASDGQTPDAGLSYNLYVGTTPGGAQVRSPHADTSTGCRRIVKAGDVNGARVSWTIEDLPGGRYWWSVQAIDTSCAGGPFAADQTFTVDPTISGRVTDGAGNGVAGVSIRGLPNGTLLTDADGRYSAVVLYDWTGTVMPYLAGGTYFTPGQRPYVRLMTDALGQDYTASAAGTARLRVQYMTYRLDQTTDTIFVNARVYNDGNANVNLADVSFKYWYSSEWDAVPEKVEIDTAFKMPSGTWVQPWTQARIDPLNPALNLQDRAQTTSFTSGAGVIRKNEYVEVHLRLHYTNWTYKYDQYGDYSFQNKTAFENTLLIPAFFKGSIVWGAQPQP